MATIRPLRGKWQAIVRRTGNPTMSKTFSLKKDAETWARSQERLIDLGQWVDRSRADKTTFRDLIDLYEREVSSNKRGAKVEQYRLAAIRKDKIASLAVSSITPQVISKWRDSRLGKVSPATTLRELQLIGHVFTMAIREWGFPLSSNPVSGIRKPPASTPRNRVLCGEERAQLLLALGSCKNNWVKPAVIFALETAARRGEILSLTWDCVDLKSRTATISGKTGIRTVPLSPACLTMLSDLPRSLDGRVFPLTVETLKQAYERAVRRAARVRQLRS